jgi:hypothetical protein
VEWVDSARGLVGGEGVDLTCGPADVTFVAHFGVCGNGDTMLPVTHTVGFGFGGERSVTPVRVGALC